MRLWPGLRKGVLHRNACNADQGKGCLAVRVEVRDGNGEFAY